MDRMLMTRRGFAMGTLAMATLARQQADAAAAPKSGGTLIFARAADSIFLDPIYTDQNADIWISLYLYDTLIQPTLDGTGLQPGLAEKYALSPDGQPDTKFADGSPITVDDLIWSLTRSSNQKDGGEFAFLQRSIKSIEARGEGVVLLHIAYPDPTILQALATFNAGIVPKKLIEAAPGTTIQDKSKAFAQMPIGSGPFVMKGWSHNNEMVLARNKYYWKKDANGVQLPYLETIRFPIIPDDAKRILKLKAGEVDATEFVPLARVQELKADPSLNMVLFPSAKVSYLNVNCRPSFKDGRKNPMADVRVRQALNYATDEDALIQVLTCGVGTPSRSFMPMSTPLAYGPSVPYPYDLAKAKALIKQAGYGSGLTVTSLALAGNADDVTQITAVQQMWSQIGVNVKIEQLESATRLARYKAGDYEMRTSLCINDINDPNEITSYFAYYPVVECNHSGFRDKDIEGWFEASNHEIDEAKRAELYQKIQERYVQDAPLIFLLEVPYPIAMKKDVSGFVQIPLGNNIFIATSVAA
jgi:peptide/nickel transport system substrate-binding protein